MGVVAVGAAGGAGGHGAFLGFQHADAGVHAGHDRVGEDLLHDLLELGDAVLSQRVHRRHGQQREPALRRLLEASRGFAIEAEGGDLSRLAEFESARKSAFKTLQLTDARITEAVRALMLGGPTAGPVTASLIWSVAIMAVMAPLAIARYRRA